MEVMTDKDVQRYAYNMSDTGAGISTGETFTTAVKEGFEGNVTDLIIDAGNAFVGDLIEPETIKGAQANSMYALSDEVKFGEDEDIPMYKVRAVGERNVARTINEAKLSLAKETTMGSVTNVLGQLAGGFADPAGIFIGGKIGSAAVSGIAKASPAAAAMLRSGGKLGSMLKQEALENLIGAAVIDAPALAANRALHGEEFRNDEYMMMVAGSVILGTAFGTGMNYITGARSVLGDAATDVLDNIRMAQKYAKNKGIPFDPESIIAIKNAELSTTRTHQSEYAFKDKLDSKSATESAYYGSYSKGTSKLYQDSSVGGGAYFFSDNKNLMENAVNSLDNTKKGNVVEIQISDAKIAGVDELDSIRGVIYQKYPDLEGKLEGLDTHEIKAVISGEINGNPDLPMVEGSFVFNKAVLDAGFDGYTAKGLSLQGDNTHNGLVILDKQSFGTKTKSKFKNFNSEGIRFDESLIKKNGEWLGSDIAKDDVVATKLNNDASAEMEKLVTAKPAEQVDSVEVIQKSELAAESDISESVDARIVEATEKINAADIPIKEKDSLQAAMKIASDPELSSKFRKLVETCLLK